MMEYEFDLSRWQDVLRCPIDQQPLRAVDQGRWACTVCDFESTLTELKGRDVPDFRARERQQQVQLTFTFPVEPLDRTAAVRDFFHAPSQTFPHYSQREIRRRFGTKLDKGIQYYFQQLLQEYGSDARILDLGCGSGGNRRYLRAIGFKHVLTVDWKAQGADLLVDAHRLPFADGVFDAVLSTAVFEHLYHPFQAMFEVSRVLRPQGAFVGGASFWEAWHGSSYFHMTPDGWHAILSQAGMTLNDLWHGWGVIPAGLYHVLLPGVARGAGYVLQSAVDGMYRLAMGEMGVRRLYLRGSGSYQVYARKSPASPN